MSLLSVKKNREWGEFLRRKKEDAEREIALEKAAWERGVNDTLERIELTLNDKCDNNCRHPALLMGKFKKAICEMMEEQS